MRLDGDTGKARLASMRRRQDDALLSGELRIIPVTGLPEIEKGEDLAELITAKLELEDGDVVVLAQKIVSKSEGRVVGLAGIEPSERALEIAGDDEDPRRIEVILREAARVVRVRPPLVIAETTHGFICASDRVGYELHSTMIAVADEIASAAELVMGKIDGVPAAIVRGLEVAGDGRARDLVIPEERDLFR